MKTHLIVKTPLNGEERFLMDTEITLAQNFGLSEKELRQEEELMRENLNGIKDAWFKHFGSGGDEHFSSRFLSYEMKENCFCSSKPFRDVGMFRSEGC